MKTIRAGQGLHDPSIDWETFQPSKAKQCHAGGNLWSDSR